MRILVLDEEFPYPTNTGKRTRSFSLYKRLAARFQIRYVAYGTDTSAAANALRRAAIEPVAVGASVPAKHGAGFYVRLFANLFSPLPYIVTSHYSQLYQSVVCEHVSRFKPSVLIFEWTPYTIYARNLPSITTLVSTHNVEADIWKRYYKNEGNWLRRAYIREQWRKVRKFERAALSWVDCALAVSEQDRASLIRERPGLRTAVVSNGVDLDYFCPTPQPVERRHLVFTGSMDWRPNQDAARYFVREIFPLLRRARPALECTLVGRAPPADILALATEAGMHVTGTVDDVRPYVERAAVYVVPLRIGGGSRLKILEALAMGRPVVSTTIGAEGLELTHNRHLLLADSPGVFADTVLRLLDDPNLCRQLSEEGRMIVEERYGWDTLAGQFGDFITRVVEDGAGQATP